MKLFTNELGHMTNKAAMPICGCYEIKMHHSGFAEIHTTSNCR